MTTSLHYRVEGIEGAPPIVLSPSLGTTLELWDPQLPALGRSFQVIRYDHPGHGGSPELDPPATVEGFAEEVVRLLDELELETVAFCGISLGGMVGMALARIAPDRVDRLVLACTAPHLGPPEGWHERARGVRAGGTATIADAVVARWFAERFLAEQPALVAEHRAMLEETPREGYAKACEAIALWDARTELGGIAAPTLVIAGADDVVAPPQDGAALAEAIPDATLTILSNAAHLANVEQPELFTEALLGFLAGNDASEEAA